MAILVDKSLLKTACLKNAKKLLRESKRLLNQKKYAWSTFLEITSFEESQKLGLLSMYEGNFISESEFRKYWHSHEYKIRSKGARLRFTFNINKKKPEIVLGSKEEAQEVIRIRGDCLYVDFNDISISEPLSINIAVAVQYINEANMELNSAISLELLEKKLKRAFKVKQ